MLSSVSMTRSRWCPTRRRCHAIDLSLPDASFPVRDAVELLRGQRDPKYSHQLNRRHVACPRPPLEPCCLCAWHRTGLVVDATDDKSAINTVFPSELLAMRLDIMHVLPQGVLPIAILSYRFNVRCCCNESIRWNAGQRQRCTLVS